MTNGDIVVLAYRLLLGRDPEPEALKLAMNSLGAGLHREDFIRSIIASDECRARLGMIPYPDVDLTVPLNGMRICGPAADRLLMPTLLKERCWEPHITAYLKANLKREQAFFDVGANIGYFSVLASPLVRAVVAFEPVPDTAKYLEWNIALNGLRNVQVFKRGLWCENKTLAMAVDPLSLAGAAISATGSEIKCVALDSLVERGMIEVAVDWIKMDVEGAEPMALAGMARTVEKYHPRFILEVNRPALASLGKAPRDVWEFFEPRGYCLHAFAHWQTTEPQPVASLDHLEALCPQDGLIDVLAAPRHH